MESTESVDLEASLQEGSTRDENINKSKLEALVERLEDEAKILGIDPTEYVSFKLATQQIQVIKGDEDADSGAVALIYNSESQEILLEVKPPKYPYKSAREKISLIGGHLKFSDFSYLEGLVREMTEEVENKEAKKILTRNARESGTLYDVMINIEDGHVYKTEIYRLHVELEDWQTVRSTKLTHDAGTAKLMTFYDVLSKSDEDFAFGHGPIIKKFVLEELNKHKFSFDNSRKSYSNYLSGYNFISMQSRNFSI